MTQQAAPGWYSDPHVRKQNRWWDGRQWTGQVAAVGTAGVAGGFFYAESRPDPNADEHVDGGLFETIANLF